MFAFLSRKFYVCSWKKKTQSYNLNDEAPYPRAVGRKGINLMVCLLIKLLILFIDSRSSFTLLYQPPDQIFSSCMLHYWCSAQNETTVYVELTELLFSLIAKRKFWFLFIVFEVRNCRRGFMAGWVAIWKNPIDLPLGLQGGVVIIKITTLVPPTSSMSLWRLNSFSQIQPESLKSFLFWLSIWVSCLIKSLLVI